MGFAEFAAWWRAQTRPTRSPFPTYAVPSPQPEGGRPTERFDQAIARDRVAVPVTLANPIVSVTVTRLPAGASPSLHFGHGSVPIPLLAQQETFEFDPPMREGLFLSNPAAAVGDLLLTISFAPPS